MKGASGWNGVVDEWEQAQDRTGTWKGKHGAMRNVSCCLQEVYLAYIVRCKLVMLLRTPPDYFATLLTGEPARREGGGAHADATRG